MHRPKSLESRSTLLAAGLLTVAAVVFPAAVFPAAVFPAAVQAGEKKAKTKAHLDYRPTYGQALLEARIRNLPLFVSRHKDF